MKLSTLKKLIKEEFLREIKVNSNSISVSPDAKKVEHQHLIDLFDGIMSKNKSLTGVVGFIDLGKNVDAYMDTLAYVTDEDLERMQEMPILIMEKAPYEIIFDSEIYDDLADVISYFYHLSFHKNGQIDNNELLYGVEGDAKILAQMPLIASYLNTGKAEY